MLVVRDGTNGKRLQSMPLGEAMNYKFGAPYLTAHRADLHGLLVARLPAGIIHLNAQCTGVSSVGGQTFDWARGDTIAAPTWTWIEHEAKTDTILFTMTDEFLMRFARYYRFEGAK